MRAARMQSAQLYQFERFSRPEKAVFIGRTKAPGVFTRNKCVSAQIYLSSAI